MLNDKNPMDIYKSIIENENLMDIYNSIRDKEHNRPRVSFARCGTQEEWDRYKYQYTDMCQVIPGTLYVNKEGICLVTSREWADWLHGKREDMPQ